MEDVVRKEIVKYTLEYKSHPVMEDIDSMIELIEWENGEGVDITINDSYQTQFISLGNNDLNALKKLLGEYSLLDR